MGCANPIALTRPCCTREPVRRVDPVGGRDRAGAETEVPTLTERFGHLLNVLQIGLRTEIEVAR